MSDVAIDNTTSILQDMDEVTNKHKGTADPHDEIMKAFKRHLTEQFTRGVAIGTKLGASYVGEKLGTPEDWVKMSVDELMDKLADGLAMAEAIKRGKLAPDTEEKTETETEEVTTDGDEKPKEM